MNELKTVLFNVIVAVIAFVGGSVIHGLLGFGMWFVHLSLLPCMLWFWWRGAMPNASPWGIVGLLAAGSAYIAIKDVVWPNAPDWSNWVDAAFFLTFFYAIREFTTWTNSKNCPRA